MRAAFYTRVSTADQTPRCNSGTCRPMLNARGWQVTRLGGGTAAIEPPAPIPHCSRGNAVSHKGQKAKLSLQIGE